ncbi:MAG: methyltransferase domain-containing protein [Deltaproteobacteria bacterium]|nr:methyltransferase domain-containing protein [Deltaproteobacteria bacterium]
MVPPRKAYGNGHLAFFRGFLRHPALIGSVIPSSRFLERRIIQAAGIAHSRSVVELGPGTGGTTRAILRALPRQAHLLAIEINPDFVNYLKAYPDPRLDVYLGSAEHIRSALETVNHTRPDAVVSGIPFSTMPAEAGRRILREIWCCLAPGGRFVAYQLMQSVAFLEPLLLGDPHVQLELLNVPPLRVYSWQKPA